MVETIECDMGSLDWKPETIDLLWSEGAAYNLTFEGALKAWRPLMAANGIAVISEMSYFTSEVPESVRIYWQNAYPAIGTESENSSHANSSGFEILGIHRLPSKAWWDNYYEPLRKNIEIFKKSNDSVMQSVISETEEEMKLFEKYEKIYGYSFYIMKAVLEIHCGPVSNHCCSIPKNGKCKESEDEQMEPSPIKETIYFNDFEKLDIRVGTITSVTDVEKSNKLLKLIVDFGDHTRSILAGIKKERANPQEIEGKQALFVLNLPEKKMAGEVSQGMLFDIGYADNITPCLAVPEIPMPNGSRAG